MKKTILSAGIITAAALGFAGFEAYEIHSIRTMLTADQPLVASGAQGAVYVANYVSGQLQAAQQAQGPARK